MDTLTDLLNKLQASVNQDAINNCGPVVSDLTWQLRQLYNMAWYSDQIGDSKYLDKVLTFSFNEYKPSN